MMGERGEERRTSPWRILAMCLGLSLVASLALLLSPALDWWSAERSTSYEQVLRRGLPPSDALAAAGSSVEAEDFVAFLNSAAPASADPYGDPWLFAALVIGYLRLYNVPLWEPAVAASYSPETRDEIRLQAGDTWAMLAESHLGNRDLWPLLILLNRDWITNRGIALDPGWKVQVAEASKLGVVGDGGIR
jgi:hypothetical protein